jgi:hypothetical protein
VFRKKRASLENSCWGEDTRCAPTLPDGDAFAEQIPYGHAET